MFTWIKKKIVNSLIEEAIKNLPEIKEKILEELKVRKDELLEGALNYIKEALIDFLKKHVGK